MLVVGIHASGIIPCLDVCTISQHSVVVNFLHLNITTWVPTSTTNQNWNMGYSFGFKVVFFLWKIKQNYILIRIYLNWSFIAIKKKDIGVPELDYSTLKEPQRTLTFVTASYIWFYNGGLWEINIFNHNWKKRECVTTIMLQKNGW